MLCHVGAQSVLINNDMRRQSIMRRLACSCNVAVVCAGGSHVGTVTSNLHLILFTSQPERAACLATRLPLA